MSLANDSFNVGSKQRSINAVNNLTVHIIEFARVSTIISIIVNVQCIALS